MNKFLKLAIFFACCTLICQNMFIFFILRENNVENQVMFVIFLSILITVLMVLGICYTFAKLKIDDLWQTINSQSIQNHNLTQLVIKLASDIEIEEATKLISSFFKKEL